MSKKIKDFLEKIKHLLRNKTVASVLSFILVMVLFIVAQYYPQAPLVLLSVLLALIFCMFFFITGIIILNSIARIAVEAGVIMSVMLFLTTSYCNLDPSLHTANDSMRFLFLAGALYGIIFLIKSFREELAKKSDLFKNEHAKNDWVAIFFFILSLILILSQFYLVLKPITQNLCIFSGN